MQDKKLQSRIKILRRKAMTNKVFKKCDDVKKIAAPASRKKKTAVATVTATFAISLTVTFASLAAPVYHVEVADDAQIEKIAQVKTFMSDANKIVNNAGLDVGSSDILDVTAPYEGENSVITVYKSGVAELTVNGKKRLVSTGGTVGELLLENGVSLGPDDYINCLVDDFSFDGMEIEVAHAFDVYVTADGKTEVFTATGGKVGEALTACGIALGYEDELDGCELGDLLRDGMEVKVLRCRYIEREAIEEIAYTTIECEDDSLYDGQSKIIKKGQNGEALRVYNDKYIGDKLVSSDCVSVTTNIEPETAIKAIGTKQINVSQKCSISRLMSSDHVELDENGLPKNYSSCFDGVATAYSGGGITATGIPAAEGYVAVDPKVIPYGSKLYIVSLDGKYVYGYCVAADTGGFVDGGWADVDLYMNRECDCVNFGIRGVRIYIL